MQLAELRSKQLKKEDWTMRSGVGEREIVGATSVVFNTDASSGNTLRKGNKDGHDLAG